MYSDSWAGMQAETSGHRNVCDTRSRPSNHAQGHQAPQRRQNGMSAKSHSDLCAAPYSREHTSKSRRSVSIASIARAEHQKQGSLSHGLLARTIAYRCNRSDTSSKSPSFFSARRGSPPKFQKTFLRPLGVLRESPASQGVSQRCRASPQ
jgi:hypothetical protein